MPHQTQQPPQTEHRAATSLLMLLFALVIRFVNLLLLQRSPAFSFKIGDAARYDAWASEIAAGNWIGEGVFYQAPLYPYFLGAVYSVFGNDIMTVRKLQAVIGAISCVLLMNAVWNLFNRRAAIAAGVVMACYVPSIFLETLLQKSVLDLFFLCLIIWLISKIRIDVQQSSRTTLRWVTLGAAIGGLCLTRENALALIPIFVIWSFTLTVVRSSATQLKKWSSRRDRALLLVAGLAIVLMPVALRNYVVGGELHLTTSQLGPNFYIGNNPAANGTYQPLRTGRGNARFEQTDAVAIASESSGRELTAAEVSKYYLGESTRYILDQPGNWLVLLGRKTLLSLNATEIIDTEDQYTAAIWSPLMRMGGMIFQFGLLAPLAILGIWRIRSRWRDVWVLLAMAGVFQATMIMFFVFGRYRFPIVPLLIVFASPVIADLWTRLAKKPESNSTESNSSRLNGLLSDLRTHWKPIAIAAIIAVVCHLPLVSTGSARAVTFNNFGVQMLMRGDHAGAQEYFEKSLAITPDNALALNNMGVLYREQGQTDLAVDYFERAIDLKPDYENAIRNLVRLQPKNISVSTPAK